MVLCESNEKWLAVAVGDDISVFAISFDLEHLFTQPLKSELFYGSLRNRDIPL